MSKELISDQAYMQRAIELARKAWGQTHPNPMVGALIVEAGEIVAEGWHVAAGEAHAEVAALRVLGRLPKPGAVLYVTLEPCSTCGRTGACTDAIIASGLRKVVVGATDPNPLHAGAGFDRLREAGVEVVSGICEAACSDLNLIFNHSIRSGHALMAMKMATTLDGKFSAANGHSQWVTGDAAREDVMAWRRYFPAIAVGAETALTDDPSLTSRLGDEIWCPRRIIFDRQLRTAGVELRVYTDAHAASTIVFCTCEAEENKIAWLRQRGVRVEVTPTNVSGYPDLRYVSRWLMEAGIAGLYIEAGPSLATGLLEAEILDYVFVYTAAKFICDSAARGIGKERQTNHMSAAIELSEVQHASFGNDFLIRGWLKGPKNDE